MRIIVTVFILCIAFCGSCFASMGIGDSGGEVLEAQKQLVAKGFFVGGLDGKFGQQMEKAVKCFQYENKVEMTGELDKATYLLLMNKELPSRFSLPGNITRIRKAVSTALGLQGVPYYFGGTSPSGFDCSGFIQYVLRHAGVSVPRMADEQYYASVRVDNPKLGDLVFFETYMPGVSHVGLSLGGGSFIHASSSRGVTISSLEDDYWKRSYVGAGRVFVN